MVKETSKQMQKEYRRVCKCCHDTFTTRSKNKRLCHICGDSKEDRVWRESKRKSGKIDPLDKLMTEIATYNQKNGTSLSYGQYVSKFGK